MNKERAAEIVRIIIYDNIDELPVLCSKEEAFHIGKIIGKMQERLECELAKEVQKESITKEFYFDDRNLCYMMTEDEFWKANNLF